MGEDVVLPCRLSPRLDAENMEVRWFRSRFSSYVHLYRSGQDYYSSQMPEYQERTELLKEGISVGNVSLRILRTRLSDEGQYQCLIKDGNSYEEATVELKVAGKKPGVRVAYKMDLRRVPRARDSSEIPFGFPLLGSQLLASIP